MVILTTASTRALFLLGTATTLFLAEQASGHGYMFQPMSRNYYANPNVYGVDWGGSSGDPTAEYCTWCLNTKEVGSVCGRSENQLLTGGNYDEWLDVNGDPMPWNSNGNIYTEGDVITIQTKLTSHHTGHMEVRACPNGRDSTQECFDLLSHRLEFVEDLAWNMPKDVNHPERGYFYGSEGFNDNEFMMRFKLPDGLVGEQVLLQWWYFTANSCTPEGYAEYYGQTSGLPPNAQTFWNAAMAICTPEQWTPDFYAGDWPERFVNCAEVTIEAGNGIPPEDENENENDNENEEEEEDENDNVFVHPTAAPVESPPIDGTCGGGSTGNGICADASLCCSQWGYCGSSDEHCNDPAPITPQGPTAAPVVPPPVAPFNHDGNSRMIAYVGNWHACPSDAQIEQYTHIVIAFAVTYTWTPNGNNCNSSCEISQPLTCNNAEYPELIEHWQNMGKKVILSFGGAGMGGSWYSYTNGCWETCFGREEYVINRLTELVTNMGLDGVDIDYEYFYEDNQNDSGFTRGVDARKFLKDVTLGLRDRMPDKELTHAPMEPDVVPGTGYYNVLQDIAGSLDFLMPQYYNGFIRSYSDFHGALSHYTDLTNTVFGGDPTKIVFGFCINDCPGFNVDGDEALSVMEWLAETYPCNGGAFFWVANDDVGGLWSARVNEQLRIGADMCTSDDDEDPTVAPALQEADPTVAPIAPTIAPVVFITPTEAPIEPTEAPIAPTGAPIAPTNSPVDPTASPLAPTEAPAPAGDGCCSNDYKTCATWCQDEGRCGTECTNMKWLATGALPSSATCAARWQECTYSGTAGCCDGLVCKGNSQWYKQCLASGDPTPS